MINTHTKPIVKNNAFITRQDIANVVISLLGFFLGRITVLQLINPVAIPFVASFLFMGRKFYFACIFVFLGFMTTFSTIYSIKYLVCLTLLVGVNFYASKRIQRNSVMMKACISSLCLLVSGLMLAYINSFSLYFTLIAALETILCFCMTHIMKKGVHIISTNSKHTHISTDDLISIAVLLGGIVAGSADIFIVDISLRYFFASLIILIISYRGGSAMSSMVGVLIGVILYILGWHDTSIIGILALAGISGGIFKKYGKVYSSVGFIFGGAVAVMYLDKSLIGGELFVSVLAANIVSLILPERFYFNIASTINPQFDNTEEYIFKIREVTVSRLEAFASAFRRLSKIFDSLAEKKTSLSQNDVSMLIDDVCALICAHCEHAEVCWDENFYNTYQAVFGMLGAWEKNGFANIEDIPPDFYNACPYINEFVNCVGNVFEKYKTDLVWHNRIVESRSLVSEQLKGVSTVIDSLAEELDFSLKFNENLEQELIEELSKNNIEVDNVIVLENKQGKYEVSFNRRVCTNKRSCVKDVIPLVSKLLLRKMTKVGDECITRDKCRIHLVEEQKFRVTSGVSRAIKENSGISGDSHSFMELKNGQCYLALSDGMGSGKKAGDESGAAMELLEEFIDAGFEKDLAIRIINSILVLKSNNDSFSTLDLCSIDLYTGAAEFVKIGAANTYLIRDGKISIIRSSSLPVGILDTVDVEVTKKKLKDSDMILMITDGVSDLNDNIHGEWISDALKNFHSNNPQDIADYVLLEAKKIADGVVKDDMTVLAARVWEKIH